MDFSKINEAATCKYLPTKSLKDLPSNTTFMVTRIEKMKTKYGDAVVISINSEFNTFLPSRIVKFFNENPEQFDLATKAVENNELTFHCSGNRNQNIVFGEKNKM